MILRPESLIILGKRSAVRNVYSKNGPVLLRFCLFCALKSNNQWNAEAELPGGADNTLSNIIASHDAPEDVDENALDLGIS